MLYQFKILKSIIIINLEVFKFCLEGRYINTPYSHPLIQVIS